MNDGCWRATRTRLHKKLLPALDCLEFVSNTLLVSVFMPDWFAQLLVQSPLLFN